MKSAVCLIALLSVSAAAASTSRAPAVTLDPPPGWSDATAATNLKGLILALRGPEGSSFVLVGMPDIALDNAAAVRSFMMNVLTGIRTGSKLDYRVSRRMETRSLRNGLSAQLLHADLAGKPRLVLAVFDAGGRPVLASLSSAAPDAMLTPLLGSVRVGVDAGAVKTSGSAHSLDGQMQIALGGGLRSRVPTPEEKSHGAVLALQGSGAEILFFKTSEDDVAPKDQPAVARATVADALKIPLEEVSLAREAVTSAGPVAVYSWARVPGSPDLRFAAGFLPWCYWGYSLMARGPLADDLLVGTLAALKQGPSAVPGLVAATPKLEAPRGGRARKLLPAAFVVVALLLLGLIVWSRARKNANLSP
ncbi:MAG: hypothetical protein A2506_08915 [Elusimicrobia bacterium RIFOXYD12_FULL_66_9]|nr:MAG: hypothetical protein A2506_08915 [Elusimicrobia bacterium RIFOXYD12_FULL_66_9]